MDKGMASQTVQNAGMTPYDVAHSIYLATVEGVSGANQNDGYGFALSAIAELWNIRGTIGNPFGRTKITNRYRGMGVTEDMILNVVSQYPNGIRGSQPLFDDLLGAGPSGGSRSRSMSFDLSEDSHTDAGSGENGVMNIFYVAAIVVFVILKFFIKWGWIASIIGALLAGCVVLYKYVNGAGRKR